MFYYFKFQENILFRLTIIYWKSKLLKDIMLLGSEKMIQKEVPKVKDDKNIKNVIAVMSGKGGVGKSTVTTLLAKELRKKGYSVGVMDADITGPSIPRLMGVSDQKMTTDGKNMYPVVTKDGIEIVSINLMIDENEPVVWRGPVIAGAVMQFWNEVVWGDLDYLLIDMPPGTGDVPLTVMKSFNIKGLIMVSVPQDMVSMIVTKAIKMARKLNMNIIGLIENMSYITCDCCNNKIYLTDENDTQTFLKENDVELLGELPMTKQIAKLTKGENEYPEEIFSKIADRVIEKVKEL